MQHYCSIIIHAAISVTQLLSKQLFLVPPKETLASQALNVFSTQSHGIHAAISATQLSQNNFSPPPKCSLLSSRSFVAIQALNMLKQSAIRVQY